MIGYLDNNMIHLEPNTIVVVGGIVPYSARFLFKEDQKKEFVEILLPLRCHVSIEHFQIDGQMKKVE